MRRDTLQVRIALLLSVALLPLGLLAVLQTQSAVEAAREAYRSGLAAETARAARPERRAILTAFGLAEGMSGALVQFDPDDAECTTMMARLSRAHPEYGFVGLIDLDMTSGCNNFAQEFDFSQDIRTAQLFNEPRPDVAYLLTGEATGEPVIVVSQPIRDDAGALFGFMSLSFPSANMVELREQARLDDRVRILTFDREGQILTSDVSRGMLDQMLPRDVPLNDLVGTGERVFSGYTVAGARRDFALVPIMAGEAYALGSRAPPPYMTYLDPFAWTTFLFPVLMWLVTLAVALWALRRNVIGPVRRLHHRIRSFEHGRTLATANPMDSAPVELRDIGLAFEELADRVIRDEAEQEDKLRERDLLLREVHHRVKNNLQLMLSIVNMQIRRTAQPEARSALQRVRVRLGSLARFHEDIYATPSLTQISTDTLVADLTRQILRADDPKGTRGAPVLDLDPVVLSPDQAGQLAMLLTEALQAVLAIPAATDAANAAPIRVALKRVLGGQGDGPQTGLRLEVEGPAGTDMDDAAAEDWARHLIAGLAAQMDARLDRRVVEGRQVLSVEFERSA